jgi:cyclohexanecarboxylate-CoA ligase
VGSSGSHCAASAGWNVYEHLEHWVQLEPHATAVVDRREGSRVALSRARLKALADRIAAGLHARGISKGDVVSFQLPNWWEAVALHLACVRIGAISNPLMPIFRERELRHMLTFAETKALVMPAAFRGFDHQAMWSGLAAAAPSVEHVFFIGRDGSDSFSELLRAEPGLLEDATPEARVAPDDVVELIYTSGTTGEPKCVQHTSGNLIDNLRSVVEHLGLGPEIILMSSPIGHQSGFMWGIVLPILLGGRVVLQDIWDAKVATELIDEEGATFTIASTPFLSDLLNAAERSGAPLASLKRYVCAGAPVPRGLVVRAREARGVLVMSCWGMTENGPVTLTAPNSPEDKITSTDGRAIAGAEVRVVDAGGERTPAGVEGRLQARAPWTMIGYLKRPELHPCDAEGWLETGDLATMDEDGYIRITGRSKDIIIRGGENIPVVEIEDLLRAHPAIRDVAIVAMPDARLGERACAFAELKDAAAFGFDDMTRFLRARQVAVQYIPERLETLNEMPRTASGKVQKATLREMAARLPAHAARGGAASPT